MPSRPRTILARPHLPEVLPRLLPLLAAVLLAPPLHAAALLDCDPSDSVLLCRLRSVLVGLRTLAAILAFVLLIAIVLAARAYRRKGSRNTPDDISRGPR